jgi:hypothetical protein
MVELDPSVKSGFSCGFTVDQPFRLATSGHEEDIRTQYFKKLVDQTLSGLISAPGRCIQKRRRRIG